MSKHLSLNDLDDLYEHLLAQRLDALRLLLSAPVYERALLAMQRRLQDRPSPQAHRSLPLSAELAQTDRVHDAWGSALWHLGQAYALHPTLAEDQRAAILRAVAACIDERGALRRSYLDEAYAARQRQPALEAHREALQSVPTTDGTLHGWAVSFTEAGLRLHALLQERASVTAADAADDNSKLRGEAIGLLYRCRAALQDELEQRPELPRDLDHRLFGYFDMISGLREPPRSPAPGAPTRRARGVSPAGEHAGRPACSPGLAPGRDLPQP